MAERAHLRLEEFSDLDLLLALDDTAAESGHGFASAKEVAERIGLPGAEPHRAVGQRLAWQGRYGSVEREFARDEAGNIRYHRDGRVMYTQNWRLTEIGRELVYGRLRKADETALGRLGDGQLLQVTRWLQGRAGGSNGAGTTAKLVEREWRYGAAQRKR